MCEIMLIMISCAAYLQMIGKIKSEDYDASVNLEKSFWEGPFYAPFTPDVLII